MKTVLVRIFASLVLLLLLVGGGGYVWLLDSEPALPAQQLFYNGRVITMRWPYCGAGQRRRHSRISGFYNGDD